MKDKKQLLIYAALAATALISLLPFFKVGFTCSDDFQYFITAQHPEIWVGDAMVYARDAGRFYFLITKFFYYIPYLIDNFAYTKAIDYISMDKDFVLDNGVRFPMKYQIRFSSDGKPLFTKSQTIGL